MTRPIAIIANGTEPTTSPERAALAACTGCVCCDRMPPEGAPALLQVVGDLDTLSRADLPAGFVTDLHADQETNDLTKAYRWLRAHHPAAPVAYFAVTGRREDHTLANLALIAETAERTTVYTAFGRFDLFPAGEYVLAVTPDWPISFLSFTPQRLTARGVVWPVEGLWLDTLWRATLNRTAGAEVRFTCQAPLFLYQPWSSQ